MKRQAANGELDKQSSCDYLRRPHSLSRNDQMNARWYRRPSASNRRSPPSRSRPSSSCLNGTPTQSATTCSARSSTASDLCSPPLPTLSRHPPPAELERSDYAVSANIGRTPPPAARPSSTSALHRRWRPGYTQFASLEPASAPATLHRRGPHPRLRVCAFNHASTGSATSSGRARAPATSASRCKTLASLRTRSASCSSASAHVLHAALASTPSGSSSPRTYDLTFP